MSKFETLERTHWT